MYHFSLSVLVCSDINICWEVLRVWEVELSQPVGWAYSVKDLVSGIYSSGQAARNWICCLWGMMQDLGFFVILRGVFQFWLTLLFCLGLYSFIEFCLSGLIKQFSNYSSRSYGILEIRAEKHLIVGPDHPPAIKYFCSPQYTVRGFVQWSFKCP